MTVPLLNHNGDIRVYSEYVRLKLDMPFIVLHKVADPIYWEYRCVATRYGQVLTEAGCIEDLLSQLRVIKLIEMNNLNDPNKKSREVSPDF